MVWFRLHFWVVALSIFCTVSHQWCIMSTVSDAQFDFLGKEVINISLLCKDHVHLCNEQVIWEWHLNVGRSSPTIPPIPVCICCYSHQEVESIFHPLNLDWPCNLVWPIQCGGSGISLFLGLVLKKPWTFSFCPLKIKLQSKETQAEILNDETKPHEGERPSQPSWRYQTREGSHLGFFTSQPALTNTRWSRGKSSPRCCLNCSQET